jgi:hypothetical protein
MPTFTDFALKSAWAACVAFPVAILVWFATRGIPCVVSWNDVTGFERPSYAPEATTATGCATYDTFVLFPANKAWFYLGGIAGLLGWAAEFIHKYLKSESAST